MREMSGMTILVISKEVLDLEFVLELQGIWSSAWILESRQILKKSIRKRSRNCFLVGIFKKKKTKQTIFIKSLEIGIQIDYFQIEIHFDSRVSF